MVGYIDWYFNCEMLNKKIYWAWLYKVCYVCLQNQIHANLECMIPHGHETLVLQIMTTHSPNPPIY